LGLGVACLVPACAFLLDTSPLATATSSDGGPSSDGGSSSDASVCDGTPPPVAQLEACVAEAGLVGSTPVFDVQVTWQATSSGISAYSVQRRDTQGHGNPYFPIALVDGGSTSYVDDAQCWEWQYDYIVIPYNACDVPTTSIPSPVTVFTLYLCDGGTIDNPLGGQERAACCGGPDGGC
jgi:hypothetical protein